MAVPEIDIEQFANLHAGGVTIIDVRNPDEYEAGHVPGAQLIPLPDLPDRLAEVRDAEPVYVICALGGRSMKAAEFMTTKGIDARNVAGGTVAWIEAGKPVNDGIEP